MDAAACIGCGACVAACPNAAAMPERDVRTVNMTAAMARELFGSCTNHGECEAVCPKAIPLEFIAGLNRDLIRAAFRRRQEPLIVVGAPLLPAHENT
jgi:succinate dehydrogenase / fumarate reductase, iron-sulfur subunit